MKKTPLKGLGQNSALVTAIADSIERQEGYAPGTRAYRNNNPGNIWDGLDPANGKTRRIWPEYPIDDEGFLKLPDYATGRALMESQIRIKINRGETLTKLINEWDSSDPPATRAAYVANVATWTGLDPNIALNTVGDFSPPGPIKPPVKA
jgi:hypothetical protein